MQGSTKWKKDKTSNVEWSKLSKAWKGFKAAKKNNDIEWMKHYAKLINEAQESLGIKKTEFKIELKA